MTNFLLIFICIISGMLIAKFGNLPKDSHKGINTWVLYIALPAASLRYVPYINWNKEMLLPALMPIVVWLGSCIAINIYKKISKIDQATYATLILTCGLTNTSFLGFPLVSAYFGEDKISIAIICDQINFLLFSTLGLIVAVKASGRGDLDSKKILKKVLKFPPFIGFIIALVIPNFIDISSLNTLLDKLSGTISPLALFSIGLQLNLKDWTSELKNLSVGLTYKLLIGPALVLVLAAILNIKGDIANISVFEAAMPSLVSSYLLVDEYNLNSKLANLMIGLGIVVCFFTTYLWWNILSY